MNHPPDHSASTPESRTPTVVEPLVVDFAQLAAPLNWHELFGNEHPVELEIGSGKGLFLANAAARTPTHNFVGVEIARKYATKAAERVAKRHLPNVRVYSNDARLFMTRAVADKSLRAVHVYFPDPWWKARHKKRRVFCEPLVVDIERTLEPDGLLWVVTDVEEYYGVIRDLITHHPRFEELQVPELKAPEHDLDYLTNFERKYRIEGRPIYRAHYRLRP